MKKRVETKVKKETQKNNVVYLNAFRSSLVTNCGSISPQIEFDGKFYPRPTNANEYLALVKQVLLKKNMEEDYKEILCAIMDPEYYQANYNYYQTNNGKADQYPIPLYMVVDTYLNFLDARV